MRDADRRRFERLMLPHLDAAYGLARCLTRNDELARDAVQEAYLRAVRYFGSLRGDDARPWLLQIVRHACYELLRRERLPGEAKEFDEESHAAEADTGGTVVAFAASPEAAAIENAEAELVRECLAGMPTEFREALVLKEIDGCSYREIALIVGVPLGTVMSRLSRARRLLLRLLADRNRKERTGT
jgi:RNA polymerase sigma-70 factor (ECF subfamily)